MERLAEERIQFRREEALGRIVLERGADTGGIGHAAQDGDPHPVLVPHGLIRDGGHVVGHIDQDLGACPEGQHGDLRVQEVGQVGPVGISGGDEMVAVRHLEAETVHLLHPLVDNTKQIIDRQDVTLILGLVIQAERPIHHDAAVPALEGLQEAEHLGVFGLGEPVALAEHDDVVGSGHGFVQVLHEQRRIRQAREVAGGRPALRRGIHLGRPDVVGGVTDHDGHPVLPRQGENREHDRPTNHY